MQKAKISDNKVKTIRQLYYDDGLSAREIAEQFATGLSSIYRLMRKHKIDRRDFTAANQIKFLKTPLSYRLKEKLSTEENKLKLAGVLLYWAEGAKGGQTVDFANSEVAMSKIFIRFLRDICGVNESRLRVYLYCHDNQKPKELINFWSNALNIPKNQFTKPYIRKYENGCKDIKKRRPERMCNGLVHVRYSDVRLLKQINNWIEEYIRQFGQVPK